MFNIKSWCQEVLDLLDLMFADFVELHGTFPCEWILTFPVPFPDFHLFLSNKGGNKWNY